MLVPGGACGDGCWVAGGAVGGCTCSCPGGCVAGFTGVGLGVCAFALEPAISNSAFNIVVRLINIECAPRNICCFCGPNILTFEHTKGSMVKFLVRYRAERGFKKLAYSGQITSSPASAQSAKLCEILRLCAIRPRVFLLTT